MQKQSGTANREENDTYLTRRQTVVDIFVDVKLENPEIFDYRFVDFSAGDDRVYDIMDFKKGTSFDINPRKQTVINRDWFDVIFDDLAIGSEEDFVLGFNPPWGRSSVLIKKFLEHALSLAYPLYIMLVHPPDETIATFLLGYRTQMHIKLKANAFERADGTLFDTPAYFTLFKRCDDYKQIVAANPKPKTTSQRSPVCKIPDWLELSRSVKLDDEHNMIIRRTGVNFLRQVLVVDRRKIVHTSGLRTGMTGKNIEDCIMIDSESYYKLKIKFRNKQKDTKTILSKIADDVVNYPRLQQHIIHKPPSTNNEYVVKMLEELKTKHNFDC